MSFLALESLTSVLSSGKASLKDLLEVVFGGSLTTTVSMIPLSEVRLHVHVAETPSLSRQRLGLAYCVELLRSLPAALPAC